LTAAWCSDNTLDLRFRGMWFESWTDYPLS